MHLALSQHIHINFVKRHAKYLLVELKHLNQVDYESHQRYEEQSACEIVISLYKCPVRDTQNQKQVERPQQFDDGKVDTVWTVNHHRTGAIAAL